MSENKLQIRAKILSAIVNLQNNTTDRSLVGNTIDDLNTIKNKDIVLEILHKELLKENTELRDYTITFLIEELIEQDKIEKTLFETLANPKINDSIKFKIVSFLREIGKHVNYEDYLNYFENPDDIVDTDTLKLLENAKINPEAQIDFLDFVNALPKTEKDVLLDSLIEDYSGDNLANILIPLILTNPYSEISQKAIKALGETKSNLAYPILTNMIDIVDDMGVKANLQKSLSLLRLSGVKEDTTHNYYKDLFKDNPVHKCYASIPDGHGNIGLIFSRKNEKEFIQMFALVINDIDGIIDCFGFNEISEQEFERIVTKFYQNDYIVEVNEYFLKNVIVNAEKLSRLKYQEISYEFAAWSMITKDIDYKNIDYQENLQKVPLNNFMLEQIYQNNILEKWFLDTQYYEQFNELIIKLTEPKNITIQFFEDIINEFMPKIFSNAFLVQFNHRLLVTAYLLNKIEKETYSNIIYSLIENSETKQKLLNDIIKKSIYEYYLTQKDKFENLKNATSIFTRRANKNNQNIDIDYIKTCINLIEENWA